MEEKQFSQSEVRDIVDKMARTLALLYHFLSSEVVADFGSKGEEAVRRAIHQYGKLRGEKIREEVAALGLPLTVENLSKYYDLPLPLAWISEKIRQEENCLEKKVTYCPFAEEWKALGGEQLGLIYCEQDLCMRQSYNPCFDLRQFTNLLQGDPHCHTIVQQMKNKS
ncbi:hypothetical protein Sgly_1108 [Syntrophobotulus glycolicus DSM 8271]|uniref:L-2-amino-thiazoline-4-carboxylic acid hydrolase n=1 Tax=Syntrophobotulus glycolicus (strain DSM 8271 / FlGlyR) TaxID=645991 RepID=F0SU50_SYNGF|nr:L-2-amino-thiazoline-4-carboxylic acid hydrolase [Syntrophobotulus glycolicus]ADY55433.1 hypothetical protein Sgly_1108 [Syntrophobotulus glycolicus DSM 8271]